MRRLVPLMKEGTALLLIIIFMPIWLLLIAIAFSVEWLIRWHKGTL